MKFVTVDIEVFAYDWLVVFKDYETGIRSIYHNDNGGVLEYLNQEDIVYIGANIKHYDQFILKGIAMDFSPEEIKTLNDFIIVYEGNGWDYPPFAEGRPIKINVCDIFDDMQLGLSLKAIEAHLGMDIEETQVDFNIDRPLTADELEKTIFYCSYDVDAAEKVFDIRKEYFTNKLTLGRAKDIPDARALYMTNAKLTAAYLDARPLSHDDEREYTYPANLLREYIPEQVFEFFDRMGDKSISDADVFSSKLDFNIGECQVTLGYGGIHGAIPCYREKATETRSIRNQDVASYYPHLMTLDGYCSRSIPDPQVYADMLETRIRAKRSGDKATANALKLVANTTYGAMLNQFNDLFDPLMGRSVCVTGQLRLLELAQHLVADCPTLKIVQLNTDGIMVSLDDCDLEPYSAICQEWQDRTGFELEEDCIREIVQKDVNNYVEIPTGDLYDEKGRPRWKIKGGCLVRGIPPAGAFNINNNATIVAKAIQNYFVFDIPTSVTINSCNDPLSFQLVAKAGSKYSGAFHYINDEKVPVQRVNRVYASIHRHYGTLVRVHAERGNDNKISGLPDHCVVDNRNTIGISEIDKSWYIKLADTYIKDFLGKRRKIKRTNTRKINSLKKNLLLFLEE